MRFGFSGKSIFFVNMAEYFKKNLYIGSNFLGGIFFALASGFAYNLNETIKMINNTTAWWQYILPIIWNNWFLLIIGSILLFIGSIGQYEDSNNLVNENKSLEDKIAHLSSLRDDLNSVQEEKEFLMSNLQKKHQELVQNWLKALYSSLNLTSHDRLTIYFVRDGEFTLLARYSSNPLISAIHNQRFPVDKGVISLAWQHGEHKDTSCSNFDLNKKAYYRHMNLTYSYPRQKIDSLTMKSNKYYGLSLGEVDETVGIIIFENNGQVDNKIFEDKCDIIKRYCKRHESYLSKFAREARRLDRLSNIQNGNGSVEREALEILRGGE